ncbi:hypothetical protein J6590_100998 [Homalodisca vitripennis]|nr:hypothetical protein J6590_100998 [Homalodisca vitripennis]
MQLFVIGFFWISSGEHDFRFEDSSLRQRQIPGAAVKGSKLLWKVEKKLEGLCHYSRRVLGNTIILPSLRFQKPLNLAPKVQKPRQKTWKEKMEGQNRSLNHGYLESYQTTKERRLGLLPPSCEVTAMPSVTAIPRAVAERSKTSDFEFELENRKFQILSVIAALFINTILVLYRLFPLDKPILVLSLIPPVLVGLCEDLIKQNKGKSRYSARHAVGYPLWLPLDRRLKANYLDYTSGNTCLSVRGWTAVSHLPKSGKSEDFDLYKNALSFLHTSFKPYTDHEAFQYN